MNITCRLTLKSALKWSIVFCVAGMFLYVIKNDPSAMNFEQEKLSLSLHLENGYVDSTTTQAAYNYSEGTDIILLAYMRSGSTFLGNLLGWRPDVFYWFEPLRNLRLWDYIRDFDLLCNVVQPSCNIIPETDARSLQNALSLLDDILHCRLAHRVNESTDLNYSPEQASPSWQRHLNCTAVNNGSKLHPKCVSYLEEDCHKASHRMVKALRIDLNSVSLLLHNNPRLKIVHLLRDPRGIINSRLRTFWYAAFLKTDAAISDDIQVICSRLRNNIESGIRLLKIYPNRVKLIQYEDGFNVKSPKISKLYEFLNIDEPKDIHANEIDKLSSTYYANRTDGFNPFLYRQQLPWNVVAMVNNHCADVMSNMGLRMFRSEAELRNESIPVIYSKLTYTIL
ncbi:carbohydrate sulfotransferase 1-like [Dreissena polymorpha]|uniref:Sulfotransferase domain-containing protein n=1 Tax=Dreissena polymorpha TaxID=45954 RepID=A0A9D4EHF3_DREPO|nr:carbohydrate sulfotransferase 1-like [Dreissena polymorpha]KAH3779695.1 hypothetical protein DPMN_157500 [Dreissena polymorpha]